MFLSRQWKSSGDFQLHNDATRLYRGVDRRPVNEGDLLVYGFFAIYDAGPQQLILIQSQSDIPAWTKPLGWWLCKVASILLKIPSRTQLTKMTHHYRSAEYI